MSHGERSTDATSATNTADTSSDGLSRRRMIQAAGAAAGLVAAPAIIRARSAGATVASPLFTLGVASGDPRATSVVLWTRLAPDPLNGGGMPAGPVPVRWQVATDPAMSSVIAEGEVIAVAAKGHAVHVVAGGLPPDTWLYYRFSAMGLASRIGRTRTFPRRRDDAPGLRFAVVSCQHYEQGFYPAWRDIAAWRGRPGQDIDFVVHTGDYIYEGAPSASPVLPSRRHSGSSECFTVEDYRNRYAQYRLDRHLQDAHANYPFIVTPDDHEVENNYAGLIPEGTDPDFAARRRGAYQVYGEQMPMRLENRLVDASGKIALFRRFHFGKLADIHVLDTRQFRSDQPAGDGFGSTDPDSAALEPVFGEQIFDAAGINAADATLLGSNQETWLADGLAQSKARWNILAQQIMLTRWNLITTAKLSIANNPAIPPALKPQLLAAASLVDEVLNVDAWDGYPAARQRLFNILATIRPSNPVVLTGDIHSAWAANLLQDFSDPNSDILAAEFVCTSISSTFLALDPRPTHAIVKAGVQADNPHITYFNGLFRGYCLCDVNDRRFQTTYRRVGDLTALADPSPLALVPREESSIASDAVFRIRAGFNQPGSGARIETGFTTPLPPPL
jgi:alkaline phosphatase D